ncbi:MAG: 2,3,4,5-tetrahydropyridine-2,6-dicarboxylate N-succinyltransferase [Proteobacteria bacterium SG_bin7]|nr:MAG: 2,3,4,5-tetrahydropyridine-2,6-dicarboxylate N-succinyltransferase [Proteobacteria bacterium SG_bin7]
MQKEIEGSDLNAKNFSAKEKRIVKEVIKQLDTGKLRVATREENNNWVTHEWIKKAILLYFRMQKMNVVRAGDLRFFDKVPVKKWTGKEGVRVVPHALVRLGACVESGCILMPSYVNIGACVGAGTMVDTWATVGSCAQIGKNVHLSGGVGIGGVLEPLQAQPVIVEDNCFIGSRAIIVEGVCVREGSVVGAGVTITKSTPIIDVTSSSEKIFKGEVPAHSVVIPGSRKKIFTAGEYQVPCALIIGKRSVGTDLKTSLNKALREFDISV